MILLGMGWVLLGLFILSGIYAKKLTGKSGISFVSPIAWEEHLQVFKGAVSCSLTSEELQQRKTYLKERIISKIDRQEIKANAIIYYFKDDAVLLEHLLEFVQKEKACCPFFKFDVSILPYAKGMALQISGSEEALKLIQE